MDQGPPSKTQCLDEFQEADDMIQQSANAMYDKTCSKFGKSQRELLRMTCLVLAMKMHGYRDAHEDRYYKIVIKKWNIKGVGKNVSRRHIMKNELLVLSIVGWGVPCAVQRV